MDILFFNDGCVFLLGVQVLYVHVAVLTVCV